MEQLGLVTLGVAVGLIASMFGLGGGILITPLLPYIVGPLDHRAAVGTSLVCILIVVSANTAAFFRSGLLHWRMVALLGVAACAGVVTASYSTQFFSQTFLRVLTGVVLLLLVWLTMRPTPEGSGKLPNPTLSVLGYVAGGFSGFSGVGTGALLSPVLLAFRVIRPEQIAPTLNAVLVLVAFLGAFSYGLQDFSLLRWEYVTWIVPGAVMSSFVGRRLQVKMTFKTRQYFILSILIALALAVFIPLF